MAVKHAIDTIKTFKWCPTPDCGFAFDNGEDLENFECPKCKKEYCLKCNLAMHDGMTCAESKVNNHNDS